MLTEHPCGKTHIQFFIDNLCIATVRVEYAEAFRKALEAISDNTANNQKGSE